MSYHPADRPMSGRDGSMPERNDPSIRKNVQGFSRDDKKQGSDSSALPTVLAAVFFTLIILVLLS